MTGDEAGLLMLSQCGKCAICGKLLNQRADIHIDHCHKTGEIRGILCRTCNILLGIIKDDIYNLIPIIMYLTGINITSKSLEELVKPKEDENNKAKL